MSVEGRFSLPGQAASRSAQLSCHEGLLSIHVTDGHGADESSDGLLAQVHLDDLFISARLGNTPRQIRLEDGSLFETSNNDAIDELLKWHRRSRGDGLLHTLESRKRFILPLLLVAVLAGWVIYVWGIPLAAKSVAYALPADKIGLIGEQTIQAMDRTLLKPSQLSEARQRAIRQRFDRLTSEVGSGFRYRLLFRQMRGDPANAFALPDGTIVLLDGLVKLSEDPWEVDGVLLHEVAHVEQRHALQMSFQDTILTLMVSLMLGDAVSTGQAVASLPVLLIENNYSQAFEKDADDFAAQYMIQNRADPNHFATMLEKLEAADLDGKSETVAADEESSLWDYFSTHPTTASRVSRIRAFKTLNH